MKTKFKKVDVKDLVVGEKYYVKCGIWRGTVTFTHSEWRGGRIYYNFTFGTLDTYQEHFNFFSTKSNLRIYKEINNA